MMIFFTVLFLTYYCITLAKGKVFSGFLKEACEEEIKKQRVGADNYKANDEFVVKSLFFVLFAVVFLITAFSYYCVALKYDPLKYPTLILLFYTIVEFSRGFVKGKKKVDLSTEEQANAYRRKAAKTRTLKGTLIQLTSITYFTYMLLQLVF
ncbi:hypothetical protein COE51_01575 [Bacillus pseudomycoides]|nr:hypothetical protein COE51_01575 [Bacillus pseudomycoides]